MEYGRVVGESTGFSGGGGPGDITGQLMDAATDVVDQIAAQPPEILLGATVAAIIAIVLLRR